MTTNNSKLECLGAFMSLVAAQEGQWMVWEACDGDSVHSAELQLHWERFTAMHLHSYALVHLGGCGFDDDGVPWKVTSAPQAAMMHVDLYGYPRFHASWPPVKCAACCSESRQCDIVAHRIW